MNNTRNTQLPEGPHTTQKFAAHLIVALACALLACGEAPTQAKQTQQRDDMAPPPLRYIPEGLRQQLDAERDLKKRTRLSLEFAEETLTRAAQAAGGDNLDAATRELGVYEAVIEDAINYVQHSGPVDNKRRDIFKRIEMTLRSHVPRIETIRRNLPARYAVHFQNTIDFVRDRRDEALNSFYDDTVIPEPKRPRNKIPQGERAKGNVAAEPVLEKKPD